MTYTSDDLIRTGHRGAGAGRCATCGAKVVYYVAAQQSSGIETAFEELPDGSLKPHLRCTGGKQCGPE